MTSRRIPPPRAKIAVEILHGTGGEIGYPIVRDMDSFMYERQSNGTMEVGSYAHRPILMHPDDIPSVAEAERSPTELPFTPGDFAPQLERAREIMGELLSGTGRHVRQRCREHFTKTYGIVHPREQWVSARGVNRSPFHARTKALRASHFSLRHGVSSRAAGVTIRKGV